MYIARILYPVKVLGPGDRVGIWLVGCKHKCKGCSNPELWEVDNKYQTSMEVIIRLINEIRSSNKIEGFTITGGDPFEQPEELGRLINELKLISDDILVYTGYLFSELRMYQDIIQNISVLIDGPYIEEQNNGIMMVGSDNQVIHILNESVKQKYWDYLNEQKSIIQNFTSMDGVISVGIHKPDYDEQLRKAIKKKGIIGT